MIDIATLNVRWFCKVDSHIVAAFAEGWTATTLAETLSERDVLGAVAETPEGVVIGFVLYRVDAGSIEVLDFQVHPEYRRRGYGSRLLARVLRRADLMRAMVITDVPETRLAAQLMLRKLGFRAIRAVRRCEVYRMVHVCADRDRN